MEYKALSKISSRFMNLTENDSLFYNYDKEMQFYIERLENLLETQAEIYERYN